jgi:[protein-PII] uridylyltransferase
LNIKEHFLAELSRIHELHRTGADGFRVSWMIVDLYDHLIRELWRLTADTEKQSFAVVALGGFGRYEMSPHSDIDLMLLFSDETSKEQATQAIQQFLHALWGADFNIGHSVRTIENCRELRKSDVDSWASLLEGRFLCGNEQALSQFEEMVFSEIGDTEDTTFLSAVVHGIDERHEKYGNAVKLLEPNIKTSAGGLRDLHSLLWLFRSGARDYFPDDAFLSKRSACLSLLEALMRNHLLTSAEEDAVIKAFRFLLRVRHETHFIANTSHDTIDFSLQRKIAQGLGYGDDPQLLHVERFMRDYYLHTRNIFRLNCRLVRLYRKSLRHTVADITIDNRFIARGPALSLVHPQAAIDSPSIILRAFYLCGLHNLEPGQTLQSHLVALAQRNDIFTPEVIKSQECADGFFSILHLKKNVATTLMLMNDFDILGKFIPEWGDLVAFFQHSVYHFYTADTHTLIALDHCERLGQGNQLLSDVFRSLQDKIPLYLAILFHDIDKPRGIDQHETRGAETAVVIMSRLHDTVHQEDVSFLIRYHLLMEQVAFRRNINDPVTVADFASIFQSPEQLDMLYLLTYCDLSAVNKNVWTSWKAMLLEQLYTRTHAVLQQKLPYTEAVAYQQTEYRKSLQSLITAMSKRLPREEVEKHFTSIRNEAYTAIFSKQEITDHIATISRLQKINSIVHHEPSYSTVTVLTHDAPFLLSNLCGVLSANDGNIFDAHIFTRDDGIVIDQFRVTDAGTRGRLSDEQTAKITQDFIDLTNGTVHVEQLFEKHHRRWKRRRQPPLLANIRIDVEFEDTPEYTIIDVYAPDSMGFLYRVTKTISGLGLNISFAKIATRVDGIVDSFYVLDMHGKKVAAADHQAQIRENILATIRQLINVQLESS